MTTATILDRELRTFEDKRQELVQSSEGRYALIHDGKVLGTYDEENEAIVDGYRQLGNIPFLVAQILPSDVPANFVNNNIGF